MDRLEEKQNSVKRAEERFTKRPTSWTRNKKKES